MRRKMRRKRKPSPAQTVIGIARYRPEQWERFLEVAADRDSLHDTHAEWLASATTQFHRLQGTGVSVQWVDVDVEELLRWCNERQVELDGAARSRFTAEKVLPANARDK